MVLDSNTSARLHEFGWFSTKWVLSLFIYYLIGRVTLKNIEIPLFTTKTNNIN